MSEEGSALDHGKRAFEIMTLHILGKGEAAWNQWVALRLSDGGSDNVLYPTKEDAMNHQLHPSLCCYIVIPPSGFTLKEITRFLDVSRELYDKNARIPSHWDYGRKGFSL